MRPTLRVLHIHKPLIHFLGKRKWPAIPEPPHAHPAGPPEYKAHFADFLKKFELSASRPFQSASGQKKSSSTSASASASAKVPNGNGNGNGNGHDGEVYEEFWQAPQRLWNPRVRRVSDEEMEAILSGGASLH